MSNLESEQGEFKSEEERQAAEGFEAPVNGQQEIKETENITVPERNGRNFIQSMREKFPKISDEDKKAITAGILSGLMAVTGVGMALGAGIDKGLTGAEAIELASAGAGFMMTGIIALGSLGQRRTQ